MGDDDDRGLNAIPEVDEEFLHFEAGRLIEGGEWLVHEDNAGFENQRACDGHALLLAAGELMRILVLVAIEADLLDEGHGGLGALGMGKGHLVAVDLEAEEDVIENGEMGEGTVLLEDHAAVVGGAVDGLAVDEQFAGSGLKEAGDTVQERALAAAGRPEHGDELAFAGGMFDAESDPGEGGEIAEADGEVAGFDDRGGRAGDRGEAAGGGAVTGAWAVAAEGLEGGVVIGRPRYGKRSLPSWAQPRSAIQAMSVMSMMTR